MAIVEVSQTGLDRAVSALERIPNRVETFMERLCELGQNAAQTAFGGSVSVTWARAGKGYEISANGQSVAFLEFGAGVDTDTGHIFADDVSFTVAPGSWSQSEFGSGQFIPGQHESWMFGGTEYTGVAPRRGMWECYKAITDGLFRTWTEVMA